MTRRQKNSSNSLQSLGQECGNGIMELIASFEHCKLEKKLTKEWKDGYATIKI